MKTFLFEKEIDWSLFKDGMAIPADCADKCFVALGITLQRGESRELQAIFRGTQYLVSFRSLPLSTVPEHADMLHIRWTASSPIACALREAYKEPYESLASQRAMRSKGKRARLPMEERLYLQVSVQKDRRFLFD